MKKTDATWDVFRLIVVGFLVFSFLSSSFISSSSKKNQYRYSLLKKGKDRNQSDGSFPVEDQENELEGRAENRSESCALFAGTIQEAELFLISWSECKRASFDILHRLNAAGVPLYIAERSLLI